MSLKPNELLQQQINLLEDANSALAARIEEHQKHGEAQYDMIHALAARIEFLEAARNRQNDTSAALTARIAVLERAHNQAARAGRLDALEDDSRALELRVLNQGMQLGDRLDALEQRLAKLERDSQLVVPGETGEWVHRDGCLVYDLDITERSKEA